MVLVGGAIAVYYWHDKPVLRYANDYVMRVVRDASRTSGLVVKQVVLQGREDTPRAKIKAALGVMPGDPIFFVSLGEAKDALEALPEIRSASLSRMLPDVISVEIKEREPVARWRAGGQEVLIDRDGLMLGDKRASDYQHLMVFVGEEMGLLAPDFFEMCESEAELCDGVIGAKRVGGRRWDVGLKNGLILKLPEKQAREAWRRVAQLQRDGLLSSQLAVIDLRLSDRIFVTRRRGKGIVSSN